jgi:outer membrane cobalamin receptor
MGKYFFITLAIMGISIVLPGGLTAQQDSSAVQLSSMSESVLTSADFNKLSCQNVGDALKHLAGVYVRNGQVALRDVAADKVVIFFDGQRLNTAQGGGVDIINLPIDNVEKIEVIRGGGSALYGADAVGGVIKITSKSRSTESAQSTMNVSASAAVGSFSEKIGSIGLSQTIGAASYFVNYKRFMTNGDFQYIDPATTVKTTWLNNDQASHDVFVKGGYALQEGVNISAAGGYYSANVGAPGLTDQLTPRARLRYDNKNLNFNYENADVVGGFNLKVQSYFLFFQTRYDQPDGLVPIHSKHNNDAYAFELQQSGNLAEQLQLAYGYTFRQDRISSSDIGSKKRNNHAAYATATATIKNIGFLFDDFAITPAARFDYPSDFDAEWSPKVSISLQKSGELRYTLTSHVARSYRAPTFNDLYWPRDSYAEGNPNLSPERGINYDVGISAGYPIFGDVSVTANYFVNLIDSLILWAPGSGGLWRPTNISKTDARGIEATARWKPFKEYIEFAADYTYMTALDKSDSPTTRDKDLIYRPRNKVDGTVTGRYEKVELNFVVHYVGKRYTNAANTKKLPAYKLMDANIGYGMMISDVNITGKIELMNLTDENIMITEGSPIPGRAFRLTVGCSL